jgi:hypothetical protein
VRCPENLYFFSKKFALPQQVRHGKRSGQRNAVPSVWFFWGLFSWKDFFSCFLGKKEKDLSDRL